MRFGRRSTDAESDQESADVASEEDDRPEPDSSSEVDGGESSGVTIRIPRGVIIALVVLVFAGGGVAAYFSFRNTETCISSSTGSEVDCGSEDAISQAAYDQQQADEAAAEAEQQQALEEAQAAADKCKGQLGGLMSAERELQSRLAVGLSYDEYGTQVGSIRVEYDQVPFKAMDLDCTTNVGLPLEDALNAYAKAAGIWGDCIQDFNCDTDSIDPELQSRWSSASNNIDTAMSGLRSLANPE